MRGDDGLVGGVEGVVFGVLLFVIGTLLIANAWGVIDAKLAASAAAREATRAFVEGADQATAMAAAEQAAGQALAGHGRDPARMRIESDAVLERCRRVTFRVRYPVPLVALPVLGRAGSGFTVSAEHAEVVDPYRSGLPAGGGCPGGVVP